MPCYLNDFYLVTAIFCQTGLVTSKCLAIDRARTCSGVKGLVEIFHSGWDVPKWLWQFGLSYIRIYLCRIFRLSGVHQLFGGSAFRVSEQTFTNWQSLKIWHTFSKIFIKINRNLKFYWENKYKSKFLRKYFNFQRIDVKKKVYNKDRYYRV